MNSIPAPRIAPVETSYRPRWSVMIPTYNGDPHLGVALQSVLSQAPDPAEMQIEVIDDNSTRGDPGALVERIGEGRVSFFRQLSNVGHSGNFNTCIRRAQGHLVHILHDDDYVRPGFYAQLDTAFRHRPDVGAAFTRSIYAETDGHWQSFSPLERATPGVVDDWLYLIASGQRVTTPSMVVRRSTYEAIGGFDQSVATGGEDWEMWVRIATRFAVWFEPEPLAIYRMKRVGSLTGVAQGSVILSTEMLNMTEVIESYLNTYLDADRASAAIARARAVYARWAIEAARDLSHEGRLGEALRALRLAWKATMPRTFARSILHSWLFSL